MPRKVSTRPENAESNADAGTEDPARKATPRRRAPARAAGDATGNPKKTAHPRTKAAPSPQRAGARKEGAREEPPAGPPAALHEQIAQLAYSYWEARGYQQGDPQEDWYRAEREILGRLHVPKNRTRK